MREGKCRSLLHTVCIDKTKRVLNITTLIDDCLIYKIKNQTELFVYYFNFSSLEVDKNK